MNISVIGAGNMGRAISRWLVDGGHSVFLANSNPNKAKAVAEEITWLGHLGRITAVSVSDAVQRGEVVILATWYSVSRQLAPEFADMFGKRVVIDVSNPLNETFDGLVSDSSTSAVRRASSPRTERTMGQGVQYRFCTDSIRRSSGRRRARHLYRI